MSFKDALAKAKAERPEPVLVPIAVGDEMFQVEVTRLDGMDWAAVMAAAPPRDETGARLGYDTDKAALIACREHGRLLDAEGNEVDMQVERDKSGTVVSDPWKDLFGAISGVELKAISATWWTLNMHDPNERVTALKKASAGGGKINSN